MIFRIILHDKYADSQSLGLFDQRDVMEFLRLWWKANDVADSQWMPGFNGISIDVEPDWDDVETDEKGSPEKESTTFPFSQAVEEGIQNFQRVVREASMKLSDPRP